MSRRYNLTDSDLKAIEKKLFMCQRIDHAIQYRKYELEVKQSHDNNIGGGRSSIISKPVEDMVMKWDADSKLQSLYEFKNRINELQDWFGDDEDMQLVFHYRWLSGKRYTVPEIADKCHITERQYFRKRRAILEKYDEICDGFW